MFKKELLLWVGATVITLVVLFMLNASGLLWDRVAMPFAEETRRITFQESQTAQSACRANLSRMYGEWTKASPQHKAAFEAMARDEASRYVCKQLDPAVEAWVRSL